MDPDQHDDEVRTETPDLIGDTILSVDSITANSASPDRRHTVLARSRGSASRGPSVTAQPRVPSGPSSRRST